MDDIINRALKKIKPSKKQEKELKGKVDVFLKRLRMRTDAEVIVGGSFAKESYLRDIKDIDIFVKFRKGSKDISGILGEILLKMFPDVKTLHGSRDYFQLEHEGIKFEIVPIIAIEKAEDAENITDISPLHVKWVVSQGIEPDEIRLAKAFAKGAGVYGAESYIQGFSGYTIEILTIHYGGFLHLLKALSRWKDNMVIDPQGYHKNVRFELNRSKLNSPLILIDPVEKGRNTAASLSKERYDTLRERAKGFLKNPDESFFFREVLTVDKLRRASKGKDILFIEGFSYEGKDDVEGCRLLKVYEYICTKLQKNDFNMLESGWDWDKEKALFWFIFDKGKKDNYTTKTGPPLKRKEDAERFRKKYSEITENSGRLYAKVKRPYLYPKELLNDIINDEYISERLSRPKLIS